MRWEEIPEAVDDWTLKSAAAAYDMRQRVANVYTASPVGYYYHPAQDEISLFAPLVNDTDAALCKNAAERAVGEAHVRPLFLSYCELADPNGQWVKVAYSQSLRRLGELLNFFPGQYPGGIPNAPSPVASMLTSGLLGAGIGYGSGKLLSTALPGQFGENLGRSGMIAGGLLGAAPGALWGTTNRMSGRSFNDPTVLNTQPNAEAINYPSGMNGMNVIPGMEQAHGSPMLNQLVETAHMGMRGHPEIRGLKRGCDMLASVPLGKRYLTAIDDFVKKAYSSYGMAPEPRQSSPADVNVNALGQTLWETGASPSLAATTMGAMYAAQQLPDPRSRPGWATGQQLGQLSANAVGDYAKGYLVGVALNHVIGTPYRATTFGAGNAALGLIGAVVPRLFGD